MLAGNIKLNIRLIITEFIDYIIIYSKLHII